MNDMYKNTILTVIAAALVIIMLLLPVKIKHHYQTSEENTTRIVEAIDRNTHRTFQLSILTVCGERGGSLKEDEHSDGADRIQCN